MQRSIAVVGAGPAGSSLAIRLARLGYHVKLIERQEFPRAKLCGEFISPECFTHFRELGVADEILTAGGDEINETVFYSRSGRSVVVPTSWFAAGQAALGLSRALMDNSLLARARSVGVEVYTNTSAASLIIENGRAVSVLVKNRTGGRSIDTDIFVDATGRSQVLFKLAARALGNKIHPPGAPDLVAFKAHMKGAAGERGRCEIYSFAHGYGGMNFVENDLSNLCFVTRAAAVRGLHGSPAAVIKGLVKQNSRAAETLRNAVPVHDWIAVAINSFGHKQLQAASNVFSVGDAAAFIDPFTGSGMLMALEGSELLAGCIERWFPDVAAVSRNYRDSFLMRFSRRLTFSGLIRHAAYRPAAASLLISALTLNRGLGRLLALSTRQSET